MREEKLRLRLGKAAKAALDVPEKQVGSNSLLRHVEA
jgi:hypothetical protein